MIHKLYKTTIGDIVDIVNGATPDSKNEDYYGGAVIWITPKDISDQRKKYISLGERTLTKSGLKSCSASIVPKGTILLTSRAPIGLISIASTDLCTNQGFKNLVPRTGKIYGEFLYYYLLTRVRDLERLGGGTTFKELSKSSLEKFEIYIPENREVQKKISNVLSALDAKIELNNRINTELEAMAKTLYDYWFVQFDFPYNFKTGKPDPNGKPYKSSGGKMVWNEELKREIPEGWEVTKLVNWIKENKNGDWGKETAEGNYTEKVYCIRGADINGLNGLETCAPPLRYLLNKNRDKFLKPHDIIIEISGGSPTQSTGRLAYITSDTVDRFTSPLICSNFCRAISLKNEKALYNFAFNWNQLYNIGVLFGFEGKTSGLKNLLFDSFVNSYWSVMPPPELVLDFYECMSVLQAKKQKSLSENRELIMLRDWLLPMLMNGQVNISYE